MAGSAAVDRVAGSSQHVAAVVDDGDVLRLQSWHRGGHPQPVVLRPELVRDVRLFELLGHLSRFAQVEVAIKQRHLRMAAALRHQHGQHGQDADRDRTHGRKTGGSERLQPFQQGLHDAPVSMVVKGRFQFMVSSRGRPIAGQRRMPPLPLPKP